MAAVIGAPAGASSDRPATAQIGPFCRLCLRNSRGVGPTLGLPDNAGTAAARGADRRPARRPPAAHGPAGDTGCRTTGTAIHRADSDRHSTVLVAADPARMAEAQHPQWQAEPVSFEQLVLAYLQRPPEAAATDGPTRAGPRPGPARKAAAQ
jgi:hypothetical protein